MQVERITFMANKTADAPAKRCLLHLDCHLGGAQRALQTSGVETSVSEVFVKSFQLQMGQTEFYMKVLYYKRLTLAYIQVHSASHSNGCYLTSICQFKQTYLNVNDVVECILNKDKVCP